RTSRRFFQAHGVHTAAAHRPPGQGRCCAASPGSGKGWRTRIGRHRQRQCRTCR
ncbi:unnamed protein product, partial [Ascophyllum nodosum]